LRPLSIVNKVKYALGERIICVFNYCCNNVLKGYRAKFVQRIFLFSL